MTKHEELDRAVERLTAVAAGAPEYGAYPGPPTYRRNAIREDLRLILSANREMREALRPFSALADMVGESWTDETPAFVGADGVTITIGQLRKARSALTTQRGDGE